MQCSSAREKSLNTFARRYDSTDTRFCKQLSILDAPAFSTLAFRSRIFQSRIFSVPLISSYCQAPLLSTQAVPITCRSHSKLRLGAYVVATNSSNPRI